MKTRQVSLFRLAAAGCLLAAATQVAAAPAALVEDIAGAKSPVRALDYLNAGQTVDLGAKGTMTIGYLASCVQERIVGGLVTIGKDQSKVDKGQVERSSTRCDGNLLALTGSQAVHSAAVAVRKVDGEAEQVLTVYHVSPMIILPKGGKIVVKRVDVPGERHEFQVESAADAQPHVDLAAAKVALTPGGTYMVVVGIRGRNFRIADNATAEGALVGRLVPF